jgi:hypothetical protein
MSNVFQGMKQGGMDAAASATDMYGDKNGSGNQLQKALMRLQATDAFGMGEEEEDENGVKRRKRRPMPQEDLSSFVSLRPGQGAGGDMMGLYNRLYSSYGGRQTRGGLLGD